MLVVSTACRRTFVTIADSPSCDSMHGTTKSFIGLMGWMLPQRCSIDSCRGAMSRGVAAAKHRVHSLCRADALRPARI
jgi:hypothetical protein